MNINYVKAKNFRSFKDLEYSFPKDPTLFNVVGSNLDSNRANGAGKSSFIELIVYAIFGKPIRKGNDASIIRYSTQESCYTEISVDDLVIKRTRRPTLLQIFINGEERTKESVIETQKIIDNHLNINFKSFLSSTIHGQHNTINFIDSPPEEKRMILKTFLNLEKIFSLREKAKGIRLEHKGSLQANDGKIAALNDQIEGLERKLRKLDSEKVKLGVELPDLSLEEIIALEKEKKRLESEFFSLNGKIGRNKQKIDEINKLLENPSTGGGSCPTCKRRFNKKTAPIEIIEEARKEGEALVKQHSEIKDALFENRFEYNHISIPIPSSEYQQVIELKNLISQETALKNSLREAKGSLTKVNKEQTKHIKDYQVMKFWEVAFSETGIIKYIIRNILGYFNERTNYYLTLLSDGHFEIDFDEELNESILIDGTPTHYDSLSGGERKSIDLAVTLGLNGLLILTGKPDCNLVFFDEIIHNLDAVGAKGVYILLQELKQEKTVFVITHDEYLQSLLSDEQEIRFIKENGISTLNA